MKSMKFALALCLVAAPAAFPADPALLALIGKDVHGVAGIYVDKTLNSPMGKYLLSHLDDESHLRAFTEATGFDPRRDLREIVAGIDEPVPGRANRRTGLVAARGVFNGAQIFAEAQKHGATTESFQGVTVGKIRGGKTAFAFFEGGVGVLGSEAEVKSAIERRSSGPAADPKLLAKANEVSTGNDAWFVGVVPPMSVVPSAPGVQSPKLPMQALQAIEQASGGLRFGILVEFSGEAVTRSEKDAQALADVVRFLTSMAQMQGGRNPEVAKALTLLDSLNVSTNAATVKVTWSAPQADLEQIMKFPRKATKQAATR